MFYEYGYARLEVCPNGGDVSFCVRLLSAAPACRVKVCKGTVLPRADTNLTQQPSIDASFFSPDKLDRYSCHWHRPFVLGDVV